MASIKCILLFSAFIAATLCGFVVAQQSTANARLLVDKEILNKYIVEGRDIVVNYHLINVGGSPAREIKIVDESFPPQRFETINGYTSFAIDEIAPGANATHTVILRPKSDSWGKHKFGSAKVTYKLNDSGQTQVGYSSELGDAFVVAARTFDKKFSSQFFDWLVFIVFCSPAVLGPYYLWNSSNSKWAALAAKQSASK